MNPFNGIERRPHYITRGETRESNPFNGIESKSMVEARVELALENPESI